MPKFPALVAKFDNCSNLKASLGSVFPFDENVGLERLVDMQEDANAHVASHN